ncbi:MAG: type IV pilus assembly protein PilM [bacterium]|nr:type IV pilus assembly protein PilM [bacterium]
MSFFSKILGQQNRYTGVDIGTNSIKMVEIEATKSGLRLVNIGIEETPSEAIEASIITEPQAVGEALSRLIAREGFSRSAAVSSLAGQSLITRLIEVPRMGDAELSEAMKWEVERYIPFPAKEVVLDFKSLPSDDAEATQMEVLLVAAKKEMVNNHIAALSSAKLDLVAIDIEPLALSRSLIDVCRNGDEEAPSNIMIVNIGASMTDITIIKDGNIGFNRGIPTGGRNVTQAISNFLLVGLDEAEQIKLTHTIIPKQDIAVEPSGVDEAGSVIEPSTETVEDYDRILNMASASDEPDAGADAGLTVEAAGDSNKMLDLASFFTQPVKPEEEEQTAGEAATPAADLPGNDGGYQGLSLEALYGIEALDLGSVNVGDGTQPATDNAGAVSEPVSGQDAGEKHADTDPSLPETAGDDAVSSQDDASGYDMEKLMEAVRPALQDIVNEIRRSLDYFRSRIKDSGNIDRIIISGGASGLKNIDNFLVAELGIPVVIADPFSMIDTSSFDDKYISEAAPVFSIAAGLAIREFLDK